MAASWKEIDRLVAEQKYQAALDAVDVVLEQARVRGDEAVWTRALVRGVQLRTALHGYGRAVRFLRAEPWPESPLHQTVLDLFYGHTLLNYLRVYGWEIGQRERVTGDDAGNVDLDLWTRDQLQTEIERACLRVWARRDEWGGESLGVLAEHIRQNDYPARIRGTLRDAVSYLWAELLADRALWRPRDENELYRLDAAALAAAELEDARVELTDPAVHPLAKLVYVLADLEAWHRGNGRPEAAFEARRTRLVELHRGFERAVDRRAIRAVFETRLERLGRQFPWWSFGTTTLAELVRDGDAGEPRDLARARELAEAAAAAHPESVGGRRGRHVAAAISAPTFQLQGMAVDGPGRRSIGVDHANLERLHFRVYALELDRLLTAGMSQLLPGPREVPQLIAEREPVAAWTVDLPPTPDYLQHTTYVVPPLETRGIYLVVASTRADFAPAGNQLHALVMQISDLVMVIRDPEEGRQGGEHEVTVRSGTSGAALAGVEVALIALERRGGAHRLIGARRSDDDGRVRIEVPERGAHLLLARRDDDAVIDPSYVSGYRGYRRPREERRTAALIYTDRSVYRPGQEVLWKVVAYQDTGTNGEDGGRFHVLTGTELTVELVDANGQEVARETVSSNDFGTVSGRFTIPAGRLLGGWQLRASVGGVATIQVEAYKRPSFEVEITDPATPLRLNRPATLRLEARYLFGLPVTAGEIGWQVRREPIYPPWWGWWGARPQTVPEVVAAGRSELDADGGAEIVFTPRADEREAGGGVSYHYRLEATVTDEGGETRSATRVFRLGFVTVEATVEDPRGFYRAGEEVVLAVERRDLDGAAVAGEGRWRLYAVDQPAETLLPAEQPLPPPDDDDDDRSYATAGDRERPRWSPGYEPRRILRLWPDGAERASGTADHGDDGTAKLELGPLPAGVYRLRYETADAWGARFELAHELVVAGDARVALPALLLLERDAVPAGEKTRILVHSGLEDQPLVLEVLRGEERILRRELIAGSRPEIVELEPDDADRGGLTVRLVALRDYQLMYLDELLRVPWDDRRLTVTLETFRDRLRPGQEETWRVVVRDADEKRLAEDAAELLAYMYDRSLELFAPHEPPDPLALYPTHGPARPPRSSLGLARQVWSVQRLAELPPYPQLEGDRLTFFDGWPIGGPGLRGGPVMLQKTMAVSADQAGLESAPAAASPAADGMAEAAMGGPPEPPAAAEPLRSDFAETAFWHPHLRLEEDGAVSFSFTVPDSVTAWRLWVHALTRDLRAGRESAETRTAKELQVRPRVPRFLREGDRANLRVVVDNTGERPLEGTVRLRLIDPVTEEPVGPRFGLPEEAVAPFQLPPGESTSVRFPLAVPPGVGEVAFEARAAADGLADGELRPVPILPGRFHLARSRFATLRPGERAVLSFADLATGDDATRIDEQLVVTVDAQLFYGVLAALPYLVRYPYDHTEVILNRYVTTGILASLFDQYPGVARMAERLAERETPLAPFDADDPNRRMALEETPWLIAARGGDPPGAEDGDAELLRVLDPRVATATRDAALAKLRELQLPGGGFPWFPDGVASPYLTLYLLYGFSKALEFGVEVPRELVVGAWSFMHDHWAAELEKELDDECCWPLSTFLAYVLSAYPDPSWTGDRFTEDDQRKMLDAGFRHWREHSPLLKGHLALALARAGRDDDARLVFDSVMDSARSDPELGTYWLPEPRAWLWYNDTVDGHAFALRTLTELRPGDPRREGLVQWLMLDKKLNHWRSTRSTAEAIYALAHHLREAGALGAAESVKVAVGPRVETFVYHPDEFTGTRNQLVIPGDELEPRTMAEIAVEKDGPGLAFASATWHFSTETLPAAADGDFFAVERRYYRRRSNGEETVLEPLEEGVELAVGDQLEVHLTLRAKHAAEYVHLRDPRPAGCEPESVASGHRWDLGIAWYEEVRDSGTNFFLARLPAGEYPFKYRLRATMAGGFKVAPAQVQSIYAPEFVAHSAGDRVTITDPPGGSRR